MGLPGDGLSLDPTRQANQGQQWDVPSRNQQRNLKVFQAKAPDGACLLEGREQANKEEFQDSLLGDE